jgi:hypothetical protein
MQWNKRTKWACALAGTALYFSVALLLNYSYVPPAAPPGEKIVLHRPFGRFGNFGASARVPELTALADLPGDNTRSHVLLYEGDHPLGPPHIVPHDVIAELGRGRYSHFKGLIAFSASDNTDANTNGRNYWAVLPKN